MHVGRKGAFALLMVAVLWTVMPAFPCLMPAGQASCCSGMNMQDCGSPAMMPCGNCCRLQSGNAPLLPEFVRTHAASFVAIAVPAARIVPTSAGNAIPLAPETQPPPGSPGTGSLLRI
ncbi:MAG TPA: hypothetical protein VHX37_06510 [Acidobacteriaceae bacterium]|jgi:hypothetical protein|nr:hypothetical protein [Acidobacteriaceae bacterium]